MLAKNTFGMINTPIFWSDGSVGSITVYKANIEEFSGWVVRRGDHKSPLPHSYTSLKCSGAGTYRYAQYNGASVAYSGFARVLCAYPYGFPRTVSSFLYDKALSKVYGKIRGDLDLSVDAFQARQTARQFKAGELLTNFFKDANKRRLLKSIPISRYGYAIGRLAASARLTWVYGWKPLIDDYYGILNESLRDYINVSQQFKATARYENSGTCAGFVESGTYNLAPYSVTTNEQVTVAITLDTSQISGLSHWSSLNPVSIGWELLPFSFVVDWFVDVGSTLRNLETALLYNKAFKSGYVSYYTRSEGKSSGSYLRLTDFSESAEGSFSFTYVNFQRSVLDSMPLPSRPTPRVSLGVPRLLNGLALVTSFFSLANPRRR